MIGKAFAGCILAAAAAEEYLMLEETLELFLRRNKNVYSISSGTLIENSLIKILEEYTIIENGCVLEQKRNEKELLTHKGGWLEYKDFRFARENTKFHEMFRSVRGECMIKNRRTH